MLLLQVMDVVTENQFLVLRCRQTALETEVQYSRGWVGKRDSARDGFRIFGFDWRDLAGTSCFGRLIDQSF